jgi:uncharacterized protein YbjT (DUF2867 family)
MLLLTGATGTIGGELARLLLESGRPFRAMVRDPSRAESLNHSGVELVRGDLCDPGSLEGAFGGASRVFVLTPAHEHQGKWKANAIAAAKRAGADYVVQVSALGAATDAPTKLGRDHAAAEQAVAESGLAYTILRPHSFMQNLLAQAGAIAARGEFYSSTGEGRIAMVDARDTARVAAQLLTDPSGHEGATYEITGPAAISHPEAAGVLSDTLGKEVRYVDLSSDAIRGSLTEMGLPEWLADDLVTLNAIYRAGHGRYASTHVQDVTATPARDFAAFVADHRDLFTNPP